MFPGRASLDLTWAYLYCEEPASSLWQPVAWLVSFGAEATNSLIPSKRTDCETLPIVAVPNGSKFILEPLMATISVSLNGMSPR